MFSLFPPTYKGRANGMRVDLAEALAATKPGVWRFPGGNNLEGGTVATRWKWNETAGYSLGGETVSQANINAYVQDAINEIQFVTGDASTNQWAKLRAQYGRTAPYKVKYIEIGNEDFFASSSYAQYRWNAFVTGIQNAFPNSGFKLLATTYPSTTLNPTYTYIDVHSYDIPASFIQRAVQYDTYPRNGAQIFLGEYAVTSTNASCVYGAFSCGRLEYPTLQGAVAEAAFMTGLERNSDVVFASAYAPSLDNVNGRQWTPDLISFNAGSLVKSASYYVQYLFSTNRGTHVLKTSPAPSASVPLHWVASHDANNKIVYIKVSNTATTTYTGAFTFAFSVPSKSASVTLLNAQSLTALNNLSNTNVVVPVTSTVTLGSTTAMSYTFPAHSVAVIKLAVDY
ncbi:glycoside hydrolase [Ceratobasidium sp. AG-I]|nr:glycoside hydrolase [Ceratobasidium sp. AG-I]